MRSGSNNCGTYFWEEDASTQIADHNDVIIPKLEKPAEEDPTEPGGDRCSALRVSLWELILRIFRKLVGAFKKFC